MLLQKPIRKFVVISNLPVFAHQVMQYYKFGLDVSEYSKYNIYTCLLYDNCYQIEKIEFYWKQSGNIDKCGRCENY